VTQVANFHTQLNDKLRALIQGRCFTPGEKFLTEREIAERFNTSRPTANKVLSGLVSEGLLEFRKGVGTFVREGVLDYDLKRLVSFTDKARAAGKEPGTQVIQFKKAASTDVRVEVVQALQASPDEPLLYMERVRLADGMPVIYEKRHVLARLCKGMTKADAKGSLYAVWTSKCGLAISGADEVIRAVNASKSQAEMLQIPTNTACLMVVAIGFIAGGRPLWHEETLYRSDVYEFRNQLGGVASPRPALGRITVSKTQ